ncbi:M43 family zinc metalloprotease [Neolewinella agarilytica]|uniref:M43 family zinc metalloprotease n=1 Tax=Neolewinella agarilytica TaxID=478744 RepID=UPI002357571E|nr:M43 family zinc metalloprotease [Neolewinella agarilytica]
MRFLLFCARPFWLRSSLMLLLVGAFALGLQAQQPSTIIDFENVEGTLTTSPELDALGVSFGTPSPTLTGLPTTTEGRLGPVTVFQRDGAPSGRNVAANCSGGIGCEFPSDAIVMEFNEPTNGIRFAAMGFSDADIILVYGYDADGRTELLLRAPVTTRWQVIEAPGALGYVIDLDSGSAARTFFIDDVEYLPGQPGRGFECGTGDLLLERLQQDPPFFREYDRIRQLTAEYLEGLQAADELGFGGEVITIPVVVHVVYNNSTDNISDAQIESQIDALNEVFRAANADVSTVPGVFAPQVADLRIQFALAQRDPNCEPTNGITRTSTSTTSFGRNPGSSVATERNPVKFTSSGGRNGWPSDEYLNIWTCDLSGTLLGYASWPADLAARPAEDGLVMDHTAFGTNGTASAPFDLGRVLAHEIGHWLNLRHIWGDDQGTADICGGSDEVDDTPNQGLSNSGCPSFPSTSCDNAPNGDMFMNYMDYVDNDCMTMFTVGQHVRAAAALFTVRGSLIGSEGHLPPPETPATPDLWSADTYDDVGDEPNATTEGLYHSADIWVRPTNDGLTNQEHVNPVYQPDGSPNYVYVRVRNRGCSGSQSGNVNLYWAKASSGLSWPSPWDGSVTTPALMGSSIGASPVTVDGGEFTILEFPWVVPNPVDYASFGADRSHFCLLSRIEDADGMTFPETASLWNNVKNNNNIVWKNISVGEAAEGDGGGFNQVIVANYGAEEYRADLRFTLPQDAVRSPFRFGRIVVQMGELYDIWQQNNGQSEGVEDIGNGFVEIFNDGAALIGIPLRPGDLFPVNVIFIPFGQGQINTVHRLNMTQVDSRTLEPIGGNQFWWRTFAEGIRFPDPVDTGGDNTPPVFVDCPEAVPTNCEFPLTVRVDMSNVPKPDDFLGNFTAVLRYDPTVMEYVGDAQILSGFTGFVNPTAGAIIFNGADTEGRSGDVPVFSANFRALGAPGTNVNPVLDLRTLVSARTFTDLTESASVFNCGFSIQEEQLLGDVNGDGRINSTDAALVLAFAVGNPIPPVAQERIDAGFGNVDGNRRTNARDALIILTYDVGLPVDFAIGEPVCPTAATDGLLSETIATPRSSLNAPLEIGLEKEDGTYLLPLTLDLAGTGERLGSYQLTASWDATRYRFVELVASDDPGFAGPNVNLSETSQGHLLLAHANPMGGADRLMLTAIRLEALTDDGASPQLDLRIEDLTAAGSFRNIIPDITQVEATTSAGDLIGTAFDLQVVPNPFRGASTFTLQLTEAETVAVDIYDSRGRLVTHLLDGARGAGTHTLQWQPAATQSAGVYLLRARVGTQVVTKRLVLLR